MKIIKSDKRKTSIILWGSITCCLGGVFLGMGLLFWYEDAISFNQTLYNVRKTLKLVKETAITEKYLTVPHNEDYAYLKQKLSAIFPKGYKALTEEEKSIAILKFVSSYHKLKNNVGTATKIIRDGYAVCGGLSRAFKILCRTAGIPARYVGVFGLNRMGSHALCEVHYNGMWHLYDPTFGIFIYSDPLYTRRGHILSLMEIIENPSQGTIMKAIPSPWKGYGLKERGFNVVPAEKDFLTEFYKFPFLTEYRNYFYEAFPVAFDKYTTVSYPVYVDLTKDTIFQVGKNDYSRKDIMQATTQSNYVGMHYIGGISPKGIHTLNLLVSKRMVIDIQYTHINTKVPALEFSSLSSIHLLEKGHTKRTVIFRVLVTGRPPTIGIISCPNGTFLVDSITIQKVNTGNKTNPNNALARRKIRRN